MAADNAGRLLLICKHAQLLAQEAAPDLTQVLSVDINYFFENMSDEVVERSPVRLTGISEQAKAYEAEANPIARRQTVELVRAYYRIDDPSLRKRLFEMTKALASYTPDERDGGADSDNRDGDREDGDNLDGQGALAQAKT